MTVDQRWASCPLPSPSARLRLFTFPYAGGTSGIYRGWSRLLAPSIELWTVHLPGRERRISEPAVPDIRRLAAAIADGLRAQLDSGPFAFFGHSMGALVAFELARARRREGRSLPRMLIVSGHRAPHIRHAGAETWDLPREAFLAELHRLNGTPPEVLQDEELLNLMLPMLRADFQADETYEAAIELALPCPITVYGGIADADVPREQLEAWRRHTTGVFRLRMLPGDHFFVRLDGVASQVAQDLLSGT